jgi:hypothetical protein
VSESEREDIFGTDFFKRWGLVSRIQSPHESLPLSLGSPPLGKRDLRVVISHVALMHKYGAVRVCAYRLQLNYILVLPG